MVRNFPRGLGAMLHYFTRISAQPLINPRVLEEATILLNYCEKALQKAQYKKLDNGAYFA